MRDALAAARAKLEERAGPSTTFEDKTLEESWEIVERLVPAYVEHWSSLGELWVPLGQEIEFCVEVGEGTSNFLRGKADNLATYKQGMVGVDYKTSGRMDPRDLLKYEIDSQLSAYIYGLSKHLTDESVARGGEPVFIRGFFVDLLVKTKIPQFAREFYTRSVEELQEFESEFNEYCDELREKQDRTLPPIGEDWKVVFPKNTEHCFRFGTCPFRDICVKDTPVRRALYDKREPDYVDTALTELNVQYAEASTPVIHSLECERTTHPNSLHPCSCGATRPEEQEQPAKRDDVTGLHP